MSDYRKNRFAWLLLFTSVLFVGCATTTPIGREGGARARVEQRAISRAVDKAFSQIDFSPVSGKSVYVETQGLSQIDLPYITSLLKSKIIENGGIPVDSQEGADIKILNIVKVSGTDEITRRFANNKVRGQFKGTMIFTDVTTKSVMKVFNLDAQVDEDR